MDVPAADDMVELLGTLDSHMMTQLLKAVATFKVSNKRKSGKQKGGAADKQ